ncbi:MAG: HTH domain-containing protein [Treponema sp.]|nr:HTH domain-containing protein [Treponema sp.]
MGNKKQSTKQNVLQILRSVKDGVSGEALAQKLNVSRTSIWKAVQALQTAGYGIEAAHGGYRLIADLDDSLCPFEFGEEENVFIHQTEISSTMNLARELACKGDLDSIKIVTADYQTDAKSYSNHEWKTTKGSLACTIVTPAKISCSQLSRLVAATQIAVCKVLEEFCGQRFFAKAPNEIYSSKGKVGGILDEAFVSAGVTVWVNLGLGLNLGELPDVKGNAVIEADISRKDFLKKFYVEFNSWYKKALDLKFNLDKVLINYKK